MYERFKSTAKEYIVPFDPDYKKEGITYSVPQRGDKKKLLDLSDKNLKQFIIDKLKHAEKLNPEQRSTRILTRLKSDLQLHDLPLHIECFDNSNIQGTNPVAACVVFKNAKPSKRDYRHFNIKTVEGPDDFASMYEIVGRRYRRLLAKNKWPKINRKLEDIVIMHYTDSIKPWHKECFHPYKSLFIYYKNNSLWKLHPIYFYNNNFISRCQYYLKTIQRYISIIK